MWRYKMRYMMKQVFLVILLAFGFVAGAQNATMRKPKKPRVENSGKPRPKPHPHPKPAEVAGYDVTFNCNVPLAMLSIDGIPNGTASGTRFLKTGKHNIEVTLDGYVDYSRTFVVNLSSRRVNITLERAFYTPNVKTFYVNGVSFEMVEVRNGTLFREGYASVDSDKISVYGVTLSGYYIGKTEVTQALWKAVMGSNPGYFKGDSLPVECVSWNDCQEFARELNALTGLNFRLPTEVEWEFACRGGNNSRGYRFSGSDNLEEVAWYGGNSGQRTHPVGTKLPNELGIYDMSGNVKEWCNDWFTDYKDGSIRVFHGSERNYDWYYEGGVCTNRTPTDRTAIFGLRLAL